MADRYDIQRFPSGLTDLLGMRATGDTPHTLNDTIFGALDLSDYFLLDRRTQQSYITGIALPGAGIATAGSSSGPAAGFIRLVYGISVVVGPVGVGATLQTHLGVQRGSTLTNVQLLPGMGTGLLAAGGVFTGGIQFEGAPLIMRPNDVLAFQTVVYTGAPAVQPGGMIHYVDIGI